MSRDASYTKLESLAPKSVAVHNLDTLDRLLFGEDERFLSPPGNNFGCPFAEAVADYVDTLATEILAEWTDLENGFRTELAAPAPDPDDEAKLETTRDIFGDLTSQLDMMFQAKLADPLGRSLEEAAGKQVELRRSGMALAALAATWLLRRSRHRWKPPSAIRRDARPSMRSNRDYSNCATCSARLLPKRWGCRFSMVWTETRVMISRRQMLSAMGVSVATTTTCRRSWAGTSPPKLFIACLGDKVSHYKVAGLKANGDTRFRHELPARGHAAAFHPYRGEVVVFARRPGTYALVFDSETGDLIQEMTSPAERHFYGHGVFSSDGRWLFTSENAIATGEGRIGIRDAEDGYRIVGEMPAGGIGPHDLALMPDDRTLVVAIGGIRTDPAQERAKLNLETMEPALVYLDLDTGKVTGRYRLAPQLFQLSIRHLDVTAEGEVAIAMQYEGAPSERVPLIALHDGADRLELLDTPPDLVSSMAQYTASVAFDSTGQTLAVAHPRGNLVTFWDNRDRSLLRTFRTVDGAGIAALDAPL